MRKKPSLTYTWVSYVFHVYSVLKGRNPAIIGKENVPGHESGGFILVANHVSMVDPLHISWAFSYRNGIRWFAKVQTFSGKGASADLRRKGMSRPLAFLGGAISAWIVCHSDSIAVDRENKKSATNMAAFKQAKAILIGGGNIGIFGNGGIGRSMDTDIARGFAFLARVTDKPVVPVYTDGGKRVIIGPMIHYAEGMEDETFIKLVMAAIQKLPEQRS